MKTSPSSREQPSGVKCYAECPHFQGVSGRCTHDDAQAIRTHFIENPGRVCPIYDDWRAGEMAILEQWIDDGAAHD